MEKLGIITVADLDGESFMRDFMASFGELTEEVVAEILIDHMGDKDFEAEIQVVRGAEAVGSMVDDEGKQWLWHIFYSQLDQGEQKKRAPWLN